MKTSKDDGRSEADAGLSRLEARIASDLEKISWPPDYWVKPRTAADDSPMLNVLVVGAGQGGLTIGFQLMRERIDRILLVDSAPPEQRGPWRTYGRMKTLRSPKFVTGPDLDIPSLTFQSWFEAQFGALAWAELGKIPNAMWSDYLAWYERVLVLPVEAGSTVTALRPYDDRVEVDVSGPEPRTLQARHVVLANGIEGFGRWWMPDFVEALPEPLRNHTADRIDFPRLKGKTVAVLGAGASAFDNAAAALVAGAEAVHIFVRRDALQRVQPFKQISYSGFLRHMGDLPVDMRWRFLRHLLTIREAFPKETWDRVMAHPNAVLHTGAGWTAARAEGGRVRIETAKGPFACDHVICGTGLAIGAEHRPELADIAPRIATWGDRFPPAREEPRLAAYPFLGSSFELQARAPADAAALARIRVFSFGSTMSFGPSGSSINALKFGPSRLVGGISAALFAEGAEAHLADLLAYETPEF
ncbi:NAD(P)-binding domain-containing protein [Jannaschia seohaensis]|uniref:Cation diffusion facilitator CzcD-associated flavoprotein CzcO n=1 Tax=Jannaschia seohaensis TaxID=475081 RepID=A0A2Y9B512_9RHOB|nr:NAD(P)-binding domain-containing protein [Jannaschia seohaensis]PWJ11169.1 cation diffusion facilitator CzcD-associated flavoprotein CzcO [Jannaschia seohaensis]SSA51470.1 Predicted flavoprotein CzcO associated with the cation diffusion facilitator CzcD [Jannaschia seohaensis]